MPSWGVKRGRNKPRVQEKEEEQVRQRQEVLDAQI